MELPTLTYRLYAYIYVSLLIVGLTRSDWADSFLPEEKFCPPPAVKLLSRTEIPFGTPNRAYESAPEEILITQSSIPEAGVGVIAQTFIKRYSWLDEYIGEILPVANKDDMSWYTWSVSRNDKITHYIDGYNIDTSSWSRFVNCARTSMEENVMSKQCKGRVYYVTHKDIAPGQELLIYYGDEYAQKLGIDIENY